MLTIFIYNILKISTNQESLIFVDFLELPEKESEYPNARELPSGKLFVFFFPNELLLCCCVHDVKIF